MALYLAIAFLPLCVYLGLIGWINLSARPFVTSGTRDSVALAIGLLGLVVAGPFELFLPESAAALFHAWVWVPLLVLYSLIAILVALVSRPRIVVYNISTEELRPILASVASELDPQARWAGDSLFLPSRSIQLSIDANPPMRNTQIVSTVAPTVDDVGQWRELEAALRTALAPIRVGRNLRGISFLLTSSLVAMAIVYSLLQARAELPRLVVDFLRW